MNVHSSVFNADLTEEDAKKALKALKNWANSQKSDDLDPELRALLHHPSLEQQALSKIYPDDFVMTESYRKTLPDLQNGPASLIKGAHQEIQHVGISNFQLPLGYKKRDGSRLDLQTSVTGTVSLEADKKGINMSRIMRSFYKHADQVFAFDVIDRVLDDYQKDLGSFDARLQLNFAFPMRVESLRSGLSGYQYYQIAAEVVERSNVRTRILHLDYVYSSTCPCSLELSEHARNARGQLATPHSQRSVARLSVVLDPNAGEMWIEDLIEACRRAVPTETQVMVKREDEQAFAELNAANPIFVEDAVRLFAEALNADARVGDFRVAASHQESLHSHDAVSVLTSGRTFEHETLETNLFQSLIHKV